jgi:methylated-DNA-[protein]-cysteine S-methyltransferase
MNFVQFYNSPLGRIIITSDGNRLTGLVFEDSCTPLYQQTESMLPIFTQTKKWLDIYFDGKEPDFTPQTAFKCTEFRKEVWLSLIDIPYGKTVTYGELARQLAEKTGKAKMSAQAIGGAVSHNPIALIIPCHRVIGSNGRLTGYAWGVERKRKLLLQEKAIPH